MNSLQLKGIIQKKIHYQTFILQNGLLENVTRQKWTPGLDYIDAQPLWDCMFLPVLLMMGLFLETVLHNMLTVKEKSKTTSHGYKSFLVGMCSMGIFVSKVFKTNYLAWTWNLRNKPLPKYWELKFS